MSAKIFDVFIYSAATVVILSIISSATQAERELKEKADSIDAVEIKEPLIKEKQDKTSEIIFTSQSSCPPCQAFKRDCVESLKKAGWRITEANPDSRATPSFDMRLDGKVVASKTGYKNRKLFFQWIRNVVETNR